MKTSPTPNQFTRYQEAFDYFNARLFAGELPPCLLNFSRHAKSYGFFVPETWKEVTGGEAIPEISLNPDHLGERDLREVFSTLVHEMAHHWQYAFGEPSRGGYHNKEWAEKMKVLGLHPSNTGEPGGKETGQRMTHYILADGAFAKSFTAMPESIRLPWCTVPRCRETSAKKKSSKTPYVCPCCESKIWGKPGLLVTCTECEEDFIEQ